MVPPRGIAPRSPAYRADALLLSYGGWGKMVAVSGIAPDSARLQRAANLSQLHSRGSPARYRAAVFRLSGGYSAIELQGNGWRGPGSNRRMGGV